jgi:ABC-type nitrate/sulfonate/bicarbonate transport system permease component
MSLRAMPWDRLLRLFNTAVSRYWGVALVLAGWQLWVTVSGVNVIVMPKPLDVLGDVVASPGVYLRNGAQTLILAAVGLVLGMALGTFIAVLAWTSRLASGIVAPLGLVFSSVPVVTLIPVLARLFGYDIKTVVAIVVVISFLPAFVFTAAGLKSLRPGSDDLFRVLGASRWRRFAHLVAPSAAPNWMIALRLAAPPAVLSAMVAEFLMGAAGLGHMFRAAMANFDTNRAFGTSLVATVVSVICFSLASLAERRVNDKWR